MNNFIPFALVLCVAAVAAVKSELEPEHPKDGDLKSEATRQRIYDIIQSHEGRKYGDHGGHEYEEGEVPLKLKNRKSRRYGYLSVDGPKSSAYYHIVPKKPHLEDNIYRENVGAYVEEKPAPIYAPEGDPYITDYEQDKRAPVRLPKSGYHGDAYADEKLVLVHDPKEPHQEKYAVIHQPKLAHPVNDYADEKLAYLHQPKAGHQVIASPVSHSHYAVADPKTQGEYILVEDSKPHHQPRPLILDPKLKTTYPLVQPGTHYDPGVHGVGKAVHLPAPVKSYGHYGDEHGIEDKSHRSSGHAHHADNAVHEESGHKSHGRYEKAGHKAHASSAGHHDQYDHHHNRGLYERDRGYHYEKAYAYDRIRAHHDIGHNRGAHSAFKAQHSQEDHKDAGDHGAESYMYFKKNDHHGQHGHHENSLHKRGHQGAGQGYHHYSPKYLPQHHHGYGKLL